MAYSGNFNDREGIAWTKDQLAFLKGKDKAMLVASNGVTYPDIELKVTTYTSFAYNGDLPEAYTALPPK
jgi:hypothetical protein